MYILYKQIPLQIVVKKYEKSFLHFPKTKQPFFHKNKY